MHVVGPYMSQGYHIFNAGCHGATVTTLYISDIVCIKKENNFHFTKSDSVYLGYLVCTGEKVFDGDVHASLVL